MKHENHDSLSKYRSLERHRSESHLIGAAGLIGSAVFNRQSERLGGIKEIMFDMRHGRVSYAVLEFGGFLGMGTSLFTVPWTALTLDTIKKCLILDASKDKLKNALAFEKGQWSAIADTVWQKGKHDYHDIVPNSIPS